MRHISATQANRERWKSDGVISFVPPDGKFELLTYRAAGANRLPIFIIPGISFLEQPVVSSNDGGPAPITGRVAHKTGDASHNPCAADGHGVGCDEAQREIGHLTVTLGPRMSNGPSLEEVAMRIPLPPSTASVSLTASMGSVFYDAHNHEV